MDQRAKIKGEQVPGNISVDHFHQDQQQYQWNKHECNLVSKLNEDILPTGPDGMDGQALLDTVNQLDVPQLTINWIVHPPCPYHHRHRRRHDQQLVNQDPMTQ